MNRKPLPVGLTGLEQTVYTLDRYPVRCPIAPESKKAKRSLYRLLSGKKPHLYRVIYDVDARQKLVRVLTIRHGARGTMEPEDEAETR